MPKPAVREIARELGLVVADKPDSQDICFVPDGDYARVVEKVRPEAARAGEIVDRDGRVLGAHRGLIHFTVGQRRGLEIGGQAEPLYVLRLEPESAAGSWSGRSARSPSRSARLGAVNWLGEGQRDGLTAKVRSLARPVPARFDGETRPFRVARIWRRARPGGGALRRRAGARRRLDRGDRRRPRARAGLTPARSA